MFKTIVLPTVKKTGREIIKRSPGILTGLGIGGMVLTVVFAVKATPKAMELINEAKEKLSEGEKEESLSVVQTVKVAYKPYIPAAISGVMSIACVIGAHNISARRNAVLATAYSLSESALKKYQEKTVEMIGEKKEREISDAVCKDKLKEHPLQNNDVTITNAGTTLCYDVISGRYFYSDREAILKAENDLIKELYNSMYVSLNEFYYMLGLPEIKLGDDLGWNTDTGMEIRFSSQLNEKGQPCLVLDYTVAPKYDYRSLL